MQQSRANLLTCFVLLQVTGLAAPAQATLFGINNGGPDELWDIDPTTAALTSIGLLGAPNGTHGLAYDPGSDTLYVSDFFTSSLYTIDPATGAATLVGAIGSRNVLGLAFDANTNTLYGSDTNAQVLLAIDTTTGAGTAVGGMFGVFNAFPGVRGLAFDPVSSTLYGIEDNNDLLITIDTITGGASVVGGLGILGQVQGLAFDPVSQTLFGNTTGELFTIDTATGAATTVGLLGEGIFGLAVTGVPEPSTGLLVGLGMALLTWWRQSPRVPARSGGRSDPPRARF